MTCEIEVIEYVGHPWNRTISYRCGDIGAKGQIILCDMHRTEANEKYPRGWIHVPGDVCKHGVVVRPADGRDGICGQCESE